MPYLLKVSSKLVIVRHTGYVACEELAAATEDIEARIDPMNPPYLLVDVRSAESFPDQEEFFSWLRNRPRKSPLVEKLAFVTNRAHSDTIETIAMGHINRGISVRVFCDEFEALDWLF